MPPVKKPPRHRHITYIKAWREFRNLFIYLAGRILKFGKAARRTAGNVGQQIKESSEK